MWTRLLSLDRRWVFVAIGLAVAAPFLLNFALPPGAVNPQTQKVFDIIEHARRGEVLLIAYDYGPSTAAELHPMALALTRHALKRGMRVIAMTIDLQGTLMADDVLGRMTREMPDKRDGVDFVNLGFKVGDILVITGLGEDFRRTYVRDARGRLTRTLKALDGVRNYGNVRLTVDLSSSDTPFSWVLFAHEKYGARLAAGVTAVMATDVYPYLQTDQLCGLLNGMRGAAEYEALIRHPDKAMQGMTAQSLGHLAIVLLVILGNLAHFATRRGRP